MLSLDRPSQRNAIGVVIGFLHSAIRPITIILRLAAAAGFRPSLFLPLDKLIAARHAWLGADQRQSRTLYNFADRDLVCPKQGSFILRYST